MFHSPQKSSETRMKSPEMHFRLVHEVLSLKQTEHLNDAKKTQKRKGSSSNHLIARYCVSGSVFQLAKRKAYPFVDNMPSFTPMSAKDERVEDQQLR